MSEPNATHAPAVTVPPDAALSPDPELWLAWADMDAWMDAHPCECEALCECDEEAGT